MRIDARMIQGHCSSWRRTSVSGPHLDIDSESRSGKTAWKHAHAGVASARMHLRTIASLEPVEKCQKRIRDVYIASGPKLMAGYLLRLRPAAPAT